MLKWGKHGKLDFLRNHDFSRIVSRFGNDKDYHFESAKLLVTLLMTMRGTPYIYQGDEIPDNKHSVSLRINYQSQHETLSSKKLDKVEKNILRKLEKQLGAFIRE